MFIIEYRSKRIFTTIALMGFLMVNGTVAMEPESPPPEDIMMEEDKPSQIDEVKEKVEGMAQEEFNMTIETLPKELLAAILVKLPPKELVVVSGVNKEWRTIAVRIMRDNLAKRGMAQPATAEDSQIISIYSNINGKLCPKIKDLNSVYSAMDNAKNFGENKKTFEYNSRTWFIDNDNFKMLTQNIHNASGKHSAFSGVAKIINPKFSGSLFIKGNGAPVNPNRVRCYYEGEFGNEFWSPTDTEDKRMFWITTILQ